MESRKILLDAKGAKLKITRLAYEIYENNINEKQILLLGIADNGTLLANLIKDELMRISTLSIIVDRININKQNPVSCNLANEIKLHSRNVIVVDDVANTGRTLLYALKPILESIPSKIQVALLFDRRHKKFPVTADYVGVQLSTTLKENVLVVFKNKKVSAVYVE